MVIYFTPAGSEFAIPWAGAFPTAKAQPDAIIRADHPPDENGMALADENGVTAVNRGRELFEANFDLIRSITAFACRKNRLNPADADEFRSDVDLKFFENDYRVLNDFKGRCALKTFLQTVITNELRDFRDRKWGKFRPSAPATRLGRLGIVIDELLHRDGWTPGEAFEHLRANAGWSITRAEFDGVVAQLPWHGRRQFVSDDALSGARSADQPDDVIRQRDLEEGLGRLLEALDRAIARLDDQPRLIIHFYREGKTIAWIARTMELNQKRLYPTLERVFEQLAKTLEEQGFDPETIRKLLDWDRL